MKKTSKKLLAMFCALLLALLFVLNSFAAAPETDEGGRRGCKSHPGPLLTLSVLSETAKIRNSGPMRAPSLQPAVTDLPLIVIVVGFKDMPYSETFNWNKSIFHDEHSLAEFYTDMSLGQFTFTPARETSAYGGKNRNTADTAGDGVVHVTLGLPHDDWALEYPYMSKKDIAANRSLGDALRAAIAAADEYIDFSAYDTDQNGAITTDELALGFVFAGYEASSSESYKMGNKLYLWSHAWSLQEMKDEYSFDFDLPSPDGVSVNSYIAISEQEESGAQEPYSTLAHELGHYIGLPDLYDTSYSTRAEWGSYSVGSLSLMCMDYWYDADLDEEIPTPLDAWSRVILGWVTPDAADGTGVYTLTAQDYTNNTGYNVLRIPTQNPGEYYLLENRAVSKWDAPLPQNYSTRSGGVVLWHIDDGVYDQYNEMNQVNDAFHRPAVMPLYPEANRDGANTFIGKTTTVKTDMPFFDRAVWNARYSNLGAALDLPIYGRGDAADRRDGRSLSGVKIEFLSNAGGEAKILLNPEGHTHNPVLVPVQEATCTAAGVGYIECPQCGKRFADETGAAESDAAVTIAALGHTAPNAVGACDRCGEQLIPQDQICSYCHRYHNDSFLQRIIAFFHRIFYGIAHLFGRM